MITIAIMPTVARNHHSCHSGVTACPNNAHKLKWLIAAMHDEKIVDVADAVYVMRDGKLNKRDM